MVWETWSKLEHFVEIHFKKNRMIRNHSLFEENTPIPTGYRLVKCISGAQINTLFSFARTNPFDFKVVLKLKASPDPSKQHDIIYYANGSIAYYMLRITCYYNSFSFQFGNMKQGLSLSGGTAYMGGERTITIQSIGSDKKIFDDLDNVLTLPNNAIFIGGTSKLYFPAEVSDDKFYNLQLENNGVVERNYIPLVRVSDNVAGFYDFCGSICPLTNTPFYIPERGNFTYDEL